MQETVHRVALGSVHEGREQEDGQEDRDPVNAAGNKGPPASTVTASAETFGLTRPLQENPPESVRAERAATVTGGNRQQKEKAQ